MRRVKVIFAVLLFLSPTGRLFSQSSREYPLEIEKMFELADRNSHSIRSFAIAEKEMQEAVKVAESAKLPSIDVSLSASFLGDGRLTDRDFSNGSNAPMPHFGNHLAFEASQILYAGGALSAGVLLARLQQQIARLDLEKNKQDIRFLLVANYLELYKLNNQSEIYRKNIEQTERLLADIKAKQQEGLTLKNDVTRYELQLQSLRLALTQTGNSQTILNNQLVTTLGLPPETLIVIDTTILQRLPFLSSENHWQETAVSGSPLLKQAHIGIRQSEHNEKIIHSDQYPSIALFAGEHLDGPITIEVPPIDKNFNYWYVGIGIKYNLASVYKTGKKVRQARLSTQRAVENEQLLQENVRTTVKAAYIRYEESFTTYRTQLKSLELAVQNYDVIRHRYLNDLALITDMLDASNSKLNAELQVANARIDILFHYYQLKKSSGIL